MTPRPKGWIPSKTSSVADILPGETPALPVEDRTLTRPAGETSALPVEDTLDLVPDADACRDVLERARQTLEWVTPQNWLLDIALDHLSLGRAHLGLAQASGDAASPDADAPDAGAAAKHLDRAVDVLRQAGQEDYLPRGLLARAVLRRFRGDLDGASADVDEAGEIAERGHMRLHACDVHLEGTRLALVCGDVEAARGRLAAARGIVEATGYRRREREVGVLVQWVREA